MFTEKDFTEAMRNTQNILLRYGKWQFMLGSTWMMLVILATQILNSIALVAVIVVVGIFGVLYVSTQIDRKFFRELGVPERLVEEDDDGD